MFNVSKIREQLLEGLVRETLRIEPKGTGFIVGLRSTGAYVECWIRDGERVFDCNMFDGAVYSEERAEEAILALETALHWKRTGVMRGRR